MFNLHKHANFNIRHWGRCTIDQAVNMLLIGENNNNDILKTVVQKMDELHNEISAIHAFYRDELCCDCCHVDVCSKRASIKFGEYCEDKPLPCCLEFELEETEDTEKKNAPITEGE